MAWTNVLDSGLAAGTFAKCFLGTLGDDLYLFGSVGEPAGTMAGVWRYRGGEWTRLSGLDVGVDFNGLLAHGAVEYRGQLHVGDRRAGKLYRLDLDSGGEFVALTNAATVGFEDVFPGPVVEGKLWLGTFGNPATPDNPGVYTYDGATVSEVKELAHLGTSGLVNSLTYWDGLVWVTAANAAGTTNEIWSVDPRSGVAHLRQSLGSVVAALCVWKGGLYGIKASSSSQTFAQWDGSALTDLTADIADIPNVSTSTAFSVVAAGDRLLGVHYYSGLFSYRDGTVTQEATGASGATVGGGVSFKRHQASFYLTTSQPVKLWKSPDVTGFEFVLNPGTSAELNLTSGDGFSTLVPADFAPPMAKPAYASSYDTEGSVATDAAHYENRQIGLKVRVFADDGAADRDAQLEQRLNALYRMVGQINREGGVLGVTTPNGTVCHFDLVPEVTATATIDKLYAARGFTFVEIQAQARPFWRGTKRRVMAAAETALPALVASAPGGGFTPLELPGLEMWLKADAVTGLADGAALTTWEDSSASNNDATQGTAGNKPTYQTNELDGLPVVRFDGSNDFMSVAGITNSDATRTVFLVAKRAVLSQGVAWGFGTSAGPFAALRARDSAWEWIANAASALQPLGGNPASWQAIVLRFNSTSSAEGFINGLVSTSFDPHNDYQAGSTPLRIGADTAAADPFNGDMAELIVCNKALSDGDVAATLGYLSDKYPTLGTFGSAPVRGLAIPGDVAAEATLVIGDESNIDRWTVIVGGQSRYFDPASTAKLFYEAEDFTPTGTSTKTAGAAGASGSGSNVVRNTDLTTTYQAILKSELDASNAALTHKGTYRVWARLYRPTGNTGAVSVRLEWAEGDFLRVTQNDPVAYAADDREGVFTWANLGIVSIDPTSTRWEFRLLAKSTVAGDELDADCFVPFPTEVVYTELSGRLQFQNPSSFSARDEFDQTAGALTGKTAPVGGVWAGAGDADDFSVETAGKTAQRTAVSDTTDNGRFATSGVAAFAAQAVQVDVKASTVTSCQQGVLARYTNTTNWLKAYTAAGACQVSRMVAGTRVDMGQVAVSVAANTFYSIRLSVDASGRWAMWFWAQGTGPGAPLLVGMDSSLATGGALATGKPGIYDEYVAAPAVTRNYDNFLAFVPTADSAMFANQSLTLAHDSATREDSTGSFSTDVSNRKGRYLKIPPSGPEGRSTRLAVLALPNDPYTAGDAAAIYDLSAQLYVTPRGLVVPEA